MPLRGVLFCFLSFYLTPPSQSTGTLPGRLQTRGPCGGLHARTEHARAPAFAAPRPRAAGQGGARAGGAGPRQLAGGSSRRRPGGGERLHGLPGYDPLSHWSALKRHKFKDKSELHDGPGSSFCRSASFLPEHGSACTVPHLSFFLLPSAPQPVTTKLLEISPGSPKERHAFCVRSARGPQVHST